MKSTVTPSLVSTTILPILNSSSTAISLSNQTSALNTTVQTHVSNSFSSASSEYFNRFILEIHESDGIHDLGIIKWEMASKGFSRNFLNSVENNKPIIVFFSMSANRLFNLLFLALEGNQYEWKGKLPETKLLEDNSTNYSNLQVVWFTALFPYAVLLALLVRGYVLLFNA